MNFQRERQLVTSTPSIATFGGDALPKFATSEWDLLVRRMVMTSAPSRFSVIGHDRRTEDSAILAWGFDFGDGEVIVESTRADRRWLISAPEQIHRYFPYAPADGLEIIWVDRPARTTG